MELIDVTLATGNKIGGHIKILAPHLEHVTTLTALNLPRGWMGRGRGRWWCDEDAGYGNGGNGGGCCGVEMRVHNSLLFLFVTTLIVSTGVTKVTLLI